MRNICRIFFFVERNKSIALLKIIFIININVYKTFYLVSREKNKSETGKVKIKGIIRKNTIYYCSIDPFRILYSYVSGFYKSITFHPKSCKRI